MTNESTNQNHSAYSSQPTSTKIHQPRTGKRKEKLAKEAEYYNRNARDLPALEGDVVRMQPFKLGQKEWKKETAKRRLGERSYEAETPDAAY